MNCFNETYNDITTNETSLIVTGLEEGTEYSVTVNTTVSGGGTRQDTLTAMTKTIGWYIAISAFL